MSLPTADAGLDTESEVAFALCDLEIAKAREVLAGKKQDVDFDRLEKSRAVRNKRDAHYVEAWNVQLPSVDFSNEPLEDDLGHGQSHRANMVVRLARDDYGDMSHGTRGEPSRRGGRHQTHFHGSIGRRQDMRDNRGSITDTQNYGTSVDRATLVTGSATARGSASRDMAAGHLQGRTVEGRPIKPRSSEGSGGPIPEISRARMGSSINAPPQHLHQPIPKRGRAFGESRFDRMLERATKIEGMGAYGAAARSVPGKDLESPGIPTKRRDPTPDKGPGRAPLPAPNPSPIPTAPAKRRARTPNPPYRLASPKNFMENAQKMWGPPDGQENKGVATAEILGSATAATTAGSSQSGIEETIPHQVTESPLEELISLATEDNEGEQDAYAGYDSDEYAALCSLFPHLDPAIVRLYLKACGGKVENAKAKLGGLNRLGLINSADETTDEPNLVDVFNVGPKAKDSVKTSIVPMQRPSTDLMDLIDADFPQAKSSHLLDEELSSSFSTLSLTPALASRSGNTPGGNAGSKASPIESKQSTNDCGVPPPSSGRRPPPLKSLAYSKWADSPHSSVYSSTISQNAKTSATENTIPVPIQGRSRPVQASTGASNSSKTGGSSCQPPYLAGSIWAD